MKMKNKINLAMGLFIFGMLVVVMFLYIGMAALLGLSTFYDVLPYKLSIELYRWMFPIGFIVGGIGLSWHQELTQKTAGRKVKK